MNLQLGGLFLSHHVRPLTVPAWISHKADLSKKGRVEAGLSTRFAYRTVFARYFSALSVIIDVQAPSGSLVMTGSERADRSV